MAEAYFSLRMPEKAIQCWMRHFFATIERRKEMACTCLPRSPDDQCPSHGYDTWKAARIEAELVSQCCGAPPLTPLGRTPAGVCGQCREHTGFERGEE